jgi:hypothetical protein
MSLLKASNFLGHFGNYDDSEIQRRARRLALATAKKILRG